MNHTISLPRHCTHYQKILAVELAAILGFESEAIDFPILGRSGDIIIAPSSTCQPEGLLRQNGKLHIYVAESRSSVDRICRAMLEHAEEYLYESGNDRECSQPDGYHASSDHPKPTEILHQHTSRGLNPFSRLEIFSAVKMVSGYLTRYLSKY